MTIIFDDNDLMPHHAGISLDEVNLTHLRFNKNTYGEKASRAYFARGQKAKVLLPDPGHVRVIPVELIGKEAVGKA
jgi:hypothetical protein